MDGKWSEEWGELLNLGVGGDFYVLGKGSRDDGIFMKFGSYVGRFDWVDYFI